MIILYVFSSGQHAMKNTKYVGALERVRPSGHGRTNILTKMGRVYFFLCFTRSRVATLYRSLTPISTLASAVTSFSTYGSSYSVEKHSV